MSMKYLELFEYTKMETIKYNLLETLRPPKRFSTPAITSPLAKNVFISANNKQTR